VENPINARSGGKTSDVNNVGKEQVLDVKNTVIKFLMDQTVGAAFNIPLFIGIIGMLKRQSMDQILTTIQRVGHK
jgi:hypothetical protein